MGQNTLGGVYVVGVWGVRRDYAEALKWFRLSADQGDAGAQEMLGIMYADGQGVPQDYAEAVKWYRLAAEQGIASAQHKLGVMYNNGKGVPQDYIRAHMWLNLSAAQDYSQATGEQAAGERDKISKLMTSAQIAEAQKLAREWQPKRH